MYELTSKNTAVMSQQICSRLRIKLCIKRYKREIDLRENLGNNNIKRIHTHLSGETVDTTKYIWKKPHNGYNELLYYDKESARFLVTAYSNSGTKKGQQCPYIHPYVPMEKLGEHLFEGLINGSEIRHLFLDYITTNSNNTKVKSLNRITCLENLYIGVKQYSLTCNQFSPRDRFKQKQQNNIITPLNAGNVLSNKADCQNGIVQTDQDFSYAEINLNGEVVIVRIVAIIQFEDPVVMKRLQDQKRVLSPEEFELENSNVMHKYVALLVLKLEKCEEERSFNQPLLKYVGSNRGCEHNIVMLDAVIRSVCIIAKFTKQFPPNYKQSLNDLTLKSRLCFKQRFHHVPIYSNDFSISGLNEVEEDEGINEDEMNQINNNADAVFDSSDEEGGDDDEIYATDD